MENDSETCTLPTQERTLVPVVHEGEFKGLLATPELMDKFLAYARAAKNAKKRARRARKGK
jgi:hypothetical protein